MEDNADTHSGTLVTVLDALRVVQRLVDVSDARGEVMRGPVVLAGGSAMAALAIRPMSEDIDLWVASLSDQVVHDVEAELRATFGPAARLDVTSTENLWGVILVRDIATSPLVGEVVSRQGPVEVRALRAEDLFILKVGAGRAKDRHDLRLLAMRTDPAGLVTRFNTLVAWHGDRGAVLGFADAFVAALVSHFGADPRGVIEDLEVPPYIRDALRESHADGT